MRSISQTKFLSENYSALRGLNAVPLGLCLLLVSFWANIVHYPIENFSLPIVCALVSFLLSIAIDRYYKYTFGEVKPILAIRRAYWIAQCVGALSAIVAFWADVTFNLPVNFIGLLFASILLLDRPKVTLPLNQFSTIKLISSLCIILVSISPLYFGKNWWDVFGVRTAIIGVTMIVGALMAIQGVAWHLLFVKSLPTIEAKDE